MRVFKTSIFLRQCLVILLLLPVAPQAASGFGSFPFSQGSARLSIHVGSSTAFDQNYSVVGLGGGYFVADGFEVGLDAETWSGNSPRITQVSPQIRYVLDTSSGFNPYAGVFYQRTFIQNNPANNTIGGRGGVFFATGENASFGAGVVHASHLNCNREIYSSCSETRPEISFAIFFR
jgi:hypothetical protein